MLKQIRFVVAALAVALFALPTAVLAGTINVPGDYPTIQEAIDASVDGDSVVVHPGTYNEYGIDLGWKGITLTSIDPTDWEVVEATVIDGRHRENVINSNGSSLLTGFTVQNGSNTGMYLNGPTTVRRCILLENDSNGITAINAPIVEDCRFIRNKSTALSTQGVLTVRGCEFIDNRVWAISMYSAKDAQISTCVIRGSGLNSSYDGIKINRSQNVEITNCVLTGNGVAHSDAIDVLYSDDIRITNCTIAGNVGNGIRTEDSTIEVRNTILWGNDGEEIVLVSGEIDVMYCDVEGGWEGLGNIDADPLFTSRSGFDYLLALGSPCIDAGYPTILDGISDWHPRWPRWYPNGARSDMGAYGGPGNRDWLDTR